jgi:hypothetical protein
MAWPLPSPSEASYLQLRAACTSLANKVLAATQWSKAELARAARFLGLPTPGGVLVFESETNAAAFADLHMGEFRASGESLIDQFDPAGADLTPLEGAVFRAWQRSRASLFRTVKVLPDTHQVRLRDLLEPERPEVLLTDIHLSESLQRLRMETLLFLRVVEVGGICMSSGFCFVFSPVQSERLLQSFRQKMKQTPAVVRSEAPRTLREEAPPSSGRPLPGKI